MRRSLCSSLSTGVSQVAGGCGRLSFTVDMDNSHEVQQYRFGRVATPGWTQTNVRIKAL